jgi:hypothetical protein
MPPMPAGTRRLFADGGEHEWLGDPVPSPVIARLLEDGDSSDLRWLLARAGERSVKAWLTEHGRRQLSRRSAAFWGQVLGVSLAGPRPGESLWPR